MKELFRTRISAILLFVFSIPLTFTLKIERKDSSIFVPSMQLTDADLVALTDKLRAEDVDFNCILRNHVNVHGVTGTKILLTNSMWRQLLARRDQLSVQHHMSRLFDRLPRRQQIAGTLLPSL